MIFMLLESWRYPEELKSLYLLKKRQERSKEKRPINELAKELDDISFCYAVLDRVSRSFAAVIRQLPEELRDSVCLFYLVLRGLDSIEDDTKTAIEVRAELLRTFHLKHNDPNWSVSGIGDSNDYRLLLENYQLVISAFQKLPLDHQKIILSTCDQMGAGMCKYLDREVNQIDEYDEYCGYVAGLVGIGLSQLFSSSGLENSAVGRNEELSNSMGLFLQKTNIIRDYHEDLLAERTFWPREIWGQYSSTLSELKGLKDGRSTQCLNHLITDALQHGGDCLTYLKSIKNPMVFRFCAIPQVMAIATLAEVFSNDEVFRKNVKIRKGLAAKLIFQANTYQEVQKIFEKFSIDIFKKIPKNDPNSYLTASYLRRLVNKQSKIKEIDLFSKERSMLEKHAMAS